MARVERLAHTVGDERGDAILGQLQDKGPLREEREELALLSLEAVLAELAVGQSARRRLDARSSSSPPLPRCSNVTIRLPARAERAARGVDRVVPRSPIPRMDGADRGSKVSSPRSPRRTP